MLEKRSSLEARISEIWDNDETSDCPDYEIDRHQKDIDNINESLAIIEYNIRRYNERGVRTGKKNRRLGRLGVFLKS